MSSIFGDGLHNVPQPILDGWRHSEYLDQIVGDPLGNAGFQEFPQVRWRPRSNARL
jgi:hypothetical protein